MEVPPIIQTAPYIYQDEVEQEQSHIRDRLFLIFSAVWGITAGLVIGQALHVRYSWSWQLIPIVLVINWAIFPFKPYNELSPSSRAISDKIQHIAFFSLSIVLGILVCFLARSSISPLKGKGSSNLIRMIPLCAQFLFLMTNLFACRVLSAYSFTPRSQFMNIFTSANENRNPIPPIVVEEEAVDLGEEEIALPEKISIFKRMINACFNLLNSKSEEELRPKNRFDNLIKETIKLKKMNQETSSIIDNIEKFVQEDPELLHVFQICREKTKHSLLSPPKKDDSAPSKTPIIEEWRQEMHRAHYLQCLKVRFRDFLEKNPTFCDALHQKLQKTKFGNSFDEEWMPPTRSSLKIISDFNSDQVTDESMTVSPYPPIHSEFYDDQQPESLDQQVDSLSAIQKTTRGVFKKEEQSIQIIQPFFRNGHATQNLTQSYFSTLSLNMVKHNQKTLLLFTNIKQCLKEDSKLRALFHTCCLRSQPVFSLLVQEINKLNFKSVEQFHLREHYQQELENAHHLEKIREVFKLFLEISPSFRENLEKKLFLQQGMVIEWI